MTARDKDGIGLALMLRLRWWKVRDWFRRCPECHRRGYGTASPRWSEDRVAQMLGIAQYGCPCCGKGAIDKLIDATIKEQP